MPDEPIISLHNLSRVFPSGADEIVVLDSVNLDIHAGEMVAIVGPSGSGKSTLMNILGCLDRASSGRYFFRGKNVSALGIDELAALRREHFGFIFQRYELLGDLNALENVEIPAIYAGAGRGVRRDRAKSLLGRLGLSERLTHRPGQLSGGQQQRVSIARALMNGGEVIFADEPTGALDTRSGKELMALLHELHRDGHTIIIISHDMAIAEEAHRIVEIRDGRIEADRRRGDAEPIPAVAVHMSPQRGLAAGIFGFVEAFGMALRAMASHRLRTFLTMLGIIIGIASVVGVVALGQGSQQTVLENISAIGTNTINIYPGTGFGDRGAGRIRTLIPQDAEVLAEQRFADSVSPSVNSNGTIRFRNVSAPSQITGVGISFFQVSGREILEGIAFDETSISTRAQEAVIDENARNTLFPDGQQALGQVIMLGRVPVRVIGVAETTTGFGPASGQLAIWVPYTTAMTRILGQNHVNSITVRIADDYDIDRAQADIETLMEARHGTADFFLQNTNTIRETITSVGQTLTLLISMIAVISLVVGGIGVMNIMLVAVTERTREIGVRMAVGARRGDILSQFLIEAVLVCLVGGAAGVLLAFGAGSAVTAFTNSVRLSYSSITIVAAFVSSTLIGIAFGFMPARAASRLNPVEALARE
jgi:macrolide transport system ATP-binding/permease protein